jgi:hypothetical protein
MKWTFPVELSEAEQSLTSRLGARSKFYIFLRSIRHRLFDDAFQSELETMFSGKPRGNIPIPAAQLAMLALLQAYESASDDAALEETKADDRWKLVLNSLGATKPPCCKKTLVFFRQRMVEHEMDKRLLAKTVQLAKETGLFDPKKVSKLRLAIDSAPLRGAGRVEDTINLVGHAMRGVLIAVAAIIGASWFELAQAAELQILQEQQSVKASLDIDWNEPDANNIGVSRVIAEADRMRTWLGENVQELLNEPEIAGALKLLKRIIEQDTEAIAGGGYRIKQGVAPERIISISDLDMRHGRKSSSQTINGYKRYDTSDLDSTLTLSNCILGANQPEHKGADKMVDEIQQHGEIAELHIDRAFLPSKLVEESHARGAKVIAKPFRFTNKECFDKSHFKIDLETRTVCCPNGDKSTIRGTKAQFSDATCAHCPLRAQCQTAEAKHGRSIEIHPQEPLMQELHARLKGPGGRQTLRERVCIEHSLAHLCASQGRKARYRGVRKNEYDLRRHSTIKNLFVLLRFEKALNKEAA